MSRIPEMDYRLLYHERTIRSVANATRGDAQEFLEMAARIPLRTEVQSFPLEEANRLLTESARGDPSVGVYSWMNPQGLIVASSRPESIGRDFSDRPYFRQIVQGRDWVVSDLLSA